MGHQHDGARLAGQRRGEPALHLAARQGVQRGEGLVEAQHGLAGEQRAQEGHALAHAARQLVRARVLEALQAERREQRVGALASGAACEAADAQGQRGVVDRAEPREQQVALGHEHGGGGVDRPGVGALQAADELEQRRLAAAARTDDGDDLPVPHPQREPGERGHGRTAAPAERARHAGEVDLALACNVSRLLHRSLEPRRHRSLRGHYPTGSKGQRRSAGAISAGLRQPPCCLPTGA